jgi:hypothetical protein
MIATHLDAGKTMLTFRLTRYQKDVLTEASWSTAFLTSYLRIVDNIENPIYIERVALLLAFRRESTDARFHAWLLHIVAHSGEESHCTAEWHKKVGDDGFYRCTCPLKRGQRSPLRVNCVVCHSKAVGAKEKSLSHSQ